jgi:hypothetical protein
MSTELKAPAPRVDDVSEPDMHSDRDPHMQPRPQSPDGKQIDVVHPEGPRAPGPDCSPADLHVCFHCAGELAYPLDWSEEGPRQWRIVLRCPDCESRREGVFDQAVVERLDDELDRAAGALLGDLRRLTHANMSEEIDFFIRALDADLIIPSDF